MDWNWYFSALAQSSAAIIGIFSAFIFTKIINNQLIFSQKKKELTSLLNESHRLIDLIEVIDFEWYFRETRKAEFDNFTTHYPFNYRNLTPEECYKKLDFSLYDDSLEVVDLIKQKIEELESIRSTPKPKGYGIITPMIQPMKIPPPYTAISEEFSKIDNSRLLTIDHIRKIKSFIADNSDNPESSELITWVIGFMLFLFYTTVIYPLSFLPITENISISLSAFWDILLSLKGGMLGALGITFTGIFIVFGWINHHMKYSSNEMSNLLTNTNLNEYSKYFDNYYHNNIDKKM